MKCLNAAIFYLSSGWCPIPIKPKDKRPLLPWEPYQSRRPTPDEVRSWYDQWPDAGVAIVTGPVSGGLVVLDVDGDDGHTSIEGRHMPPTCCVQTGRGTHYYLRSQTHIGNATGILPGLDVRGAGGYVVAPPSIHPSGTAYHWWEELDPRKLPPADAPPWILELCRTRKQPEQPAMRTADEAWVRILIEGVGEGERNSTATRLAGHLLRHYLSPRVTAALLAIWNQRNQPPLEDEELIRIVQSVAALEATRRNGRTA